MTSGKPGSSQSSSSSSKSKAQSASSSSSTSSFNSKDSRQNRITVACERCRKRHKRCYGGNPCLNCIRSKAECVYVEGERKIVVTLRYIQNLQNENSQLKSLLEQSKDSVQRLDPSSTSSTANGSSGTATDNGYPVRSSPSSHIPTAQASHPHHQTFLSTDIPNQSAEHIHNNGNLAFRPPLSDAPLPKRPRNDSHSHPPPSHPPPPPHSYYQPPIYSTQMPSTHSIPPHVQQQHLMYDNSSEPAYHTQQHPLPQTTSGPSLAAYQQPPQQQQQQPPGPPSSTSPSLPSQSLSNLEPFGQPILKRDGLSFQLVYSRPGQSDVEINYCLPSYEQALKCLDIFYEYHGYCYYFFNLGRFKERLKKTYENTSPAIKVNRDDLAWIVILLLVFSISELYGSQGVSKLPHVFLVDPRVKQFYDVPGIKFAIHASYIIPLILDTMQTEDESVVVVQALLLQTYYFLQINAPSSYYIFGGLSTRYALRLGLHCDAYKEKLPSHEVEHRRRLWWTVYIVDRYCSAKSGFSTSIDTGIICSDIPKHVEPDPQSPDVFEDEAIITSFINIAHIGSIVLSSLYHPHKQIQILPVIVYVLKNLYQWRENLASRLCVDFSAQNLNLNRTLTTIHVCHYQTINLAVRPLLLYFVFKRLELIAKYAQEDEQQENSEKKKRKRKESGNKSRRNGPIDLRLYSPEFVSIISSTFQSSVQVVRAVSTSFNNNLVAANSYLDREMLVGAVSTLILLNAAFGLNYYALLQLKIGMDVLYSMGKRGNLRSEALCDQLAKLIVSLERRGIPSFVHGERAAPGVAQQEIVSKGLGATQRNPKATDNQASLFWDFDKYRQISTDNGTDPNSNTNNNDKSNLHPTQSINSNSGHHTKQQLPQYSRNGNTSDKHLDCSQPDNISTLLPSQNFPTVASSNAHLPSITKFLPDSDNPYRKSSTAYSLLYPTAKYPKGPLNHDHESVNNNDISNNDNIEHNTNRKNDNVQYQSSHSTHNVMNNNNNNNNPNNNHSSNNQQYYNSDNKTSESNNHVFSSASTTEHHQHTHHRISGNSSNHSSTISPNIVCDLAPSASSNFLLLGLDEHSTTQFTCIPVDTWATPLRYRPYNLKFASLASNNSAEASCTCNFSIFGRNPATGGERGGKCASCLNKSNNNIFNPEDELKDSLFANKKTDPSDPDWWPETERIFWIDLSLSDIHWKASLAEAF